VTTGTAFDIEYYIGVLWRRKWVILPIALLTPIVVYVIAAGQPAAYASTADVLVNRQVQSLYGFSDPDESHPARTLMTQSQLARLPDVAKRVLVAAGLPGRSPFNFLTHSFVDVDLDTDIMRFTVVDSDPGLAERLTTEYARQYVNYRRQLDTAALRQALRVVERRMRAVAKQGGVGTDLYASLADKQQQLETAITLQVAAASVIRPAAGAGQVAPRPERDTMLAFLLAVAVGIGAAFLLESLDVRVRSPDEIEDRLGLRLVGRLSDPADHVTGTGAPVMLTRPESAAGETFALLRTSLDFQNVGRECRTILVTSATDNEGKSTTIANLAVALARTGRNVAVLDLDLRKPKLHEIFGVERHPGVTDVVLERDDVNDVVRKLSFDLTLTDVSSTFAEEQRDLPDRARTGAGARPGQRRHAVIRFVTAGTPELHPGEFVVNPALGELIEELAERFEIMLVDGPPMLLAADTLALSTRVDGLLVVARMNVVRRPQLRELKRLLDASPAEKLGLVVTDVSPRSAWLLGHVRGRARRRTGSLAPNSD
jgi:Mrp family chromosome partitioning ATPase/capsular polysaccharide biosynthesis protein